MKTKISTQPSNSKKKKVFISLGIVLAIIIAMFGWWVFRSYPLGDKLEYLGKQDLGGGLFFYATRYSEYYYGTDMTLKETADYFKSAKADDASRLESIQGGGGIPNLFFTNIKSGKRFAIRYDTTQPHTLPPDYIRNYSQKYVISITSSDYEIAKKSLSEQ